MIRLFTFVLLIFLFSDTISQQLPENYYRTQAAIELGKYQQAIQYIDSAINTSYRNPFLWIKRGEINYILHNFSTALEDFKTAEKYRKDIASYWLAKTYAQRNEKENALIELERHLNSISKEAEATILLDTAFSSIKNTIEWKNFWLNNWYTANERFLAEVAYRFSRKEWDYALDILNERLDGRRGRHQLYALRGEAYYHIGSYKSAEADFKQALKRSRRNHEYMAWRAKALMALKRNRSAIRHLNQAIEQSGGEPSYYLIRASAFANNKDYNKAIEDIKHYLSFYPNNMDAITQYAVYSIEAGKTIDALFQLGKLINNNPSEPKYYLLRGNIYMKTSNWEVAEIDFNKAIELKTKNSEAFLNRGKCRQNLGQTSKACTDWKKAIELGSFEAQELVYRNCR